MDFGKAFTFMFEDPDALRKLGIGTLVGLVGIMTSPLLIGFIPLLIALGYTLETLRNVMDGRRLPLPEWEDWGGFLLHGLRLIGVFIVWSLPLILTAIPLAIGSALMEDNRNWNILGALFVSCGLCLSLLWGLILTLLSPAIYVRVAYTGRFSAGLELGKLWAFTRDNLGNVIVAILLTWVAGLIASIIAGLGLLAFLVGILISIPFASLWQYLVQAHLFGQIGATSVTPVE